MKILIAEDNPVNQMVTKKIIEKLGAEASIAGNGVEAVKMAAGTSFDLILMDINMPEMSGIEATLALRGRGYDRPIYAMTGDSGEEAEQELESAGIDGFLSKPVNLKKLEETIMKYSNNNQEFDDPEKSIEHVMTQLGLDRDTIQELMGEFIKDSMKHLVPLKTAVDSGNLNVTATEAHYIKGAARNMGVNIIAESAERLEKTAKSEMDENYAALYEDLEIKLKGLRDKVENG
ncbi:response regulator [Limisalsivibrio acetivorans]|uniref:response regulator n=1 Tax=Limisalsivibrio acetivorans TaxID=1304888 RepID=UPI0003B3AA14|nr:response regulator [Limisalsivibrio acetivorans]